MSGWDFGRVECGPTPRYGWAWERGALSYIGYVQFENHDGGFATERGPYRALTKWGIKRKLKRAVEREQCGRRGTDGH